MSASEKLKAHGGMFRLLEVGATSAAYVEVSFWPQIVAVVEAAELLVEESKLIMHPEYPNRLMSTRASITALTALEEALS